MGEDILVVKKEKEKLKVKVAKKEFNRWSPTRYEKIINGKDYNLLAYLLYDLHSMGYNVEKAYIKFKELINEPDLFFLR